MRHFSLAYVCNKYIFIIHLNLIKAFHALDIMMAPLSYNFFFFFLNVASPTLWEVDDIAQTKVNLFMSAKVGVSTRS